MIWRSLAIGLCLGASALVQAAPVAPIAARSPVALNFVGVSLLSFAQATYKNMLGRDFVISPELVGLDKRITISVGMLDAAALPGFVDGLLRTEGIASELRDGIYYLDVAKRGEGAVAPSVVASIHGYVPTAAMAPALDPAALPVKIAAPDRVGVYRPLHRSVDFMVTVLNAAFGSPVARPGGDQVVLSVPDARYDAVRQLADTLDVQPRTVEVSASFVEVTRSNSSARGLALVASVLGRRFGATFNAGAGSLAVSAGGFQLVLDALEADGRFKQISNSRVVGDEAEKMLLSVGDETPTISSTGRDNQGNAVQSVVYRPSGVILDVLPRVVGSGAVWLQVDGQVSSFQATANGVSGSPTLVKRQVKTAVTVADGAVLVIGGLDDTKTVGNRSGFSFLPATWSTRSESDTHTDLILILSAKVAKAVTN